MIDTSIHLSDLFLIGGGILAFLKIFLSMRDLIRDLDARVGKDHPPPPTGLTGDVRTLQTEQRHLRETVIRAGLDRA